MTNSAKHTLQYLVSEGGGKTQCEDRVGMFENVCWVLDGASLPPSLTNEFGHATLWYVKTLGIELSNAVYAARPDTPLADILCAAICALNGRMKKGKREEYFLPSSTVILLRVNLLELEYLVLGDSFLVVE